MREREDDFNWFTEDCIVVREQPATAVYTNSNGALVIRQEKLWNQEDDPFVFIAPENVPTLIRAIIRESGLAVMKEFRPDIDWPKVEAAFDESEKRLNAKPPLEDQQDQLPLAAAAE